MARFDQFGPKAARLLANDNTVCIATIGENIMYRDPFYCSDRDYVGWHIPTNEKQYFRTWDQAVDWIKTLAAQQ